MSEYCEFLRSQGDVSMLVSFRATAQNYSIHNYTWVTGNPCGLVWLRTFVTSLPPFLFSLIYLYLRLWYTENAPIWEVCASKCLALLFWKSMFCPSTNRLSPAVVTYCFCFAAHLLQFMGVVEFLTCDTGRQQRADRNQTSYWKVKPVGSATPQSF